MAKECAICKNTIGAITSRAKLKDGYVCDKCHIEMVGKSILVTPVSELKKYSKCTAEEFPAQAKETAMLISSAVSDMKNSFAEAKTAFAELKGVFSDDFNPTKKIGDISFDDNTMRFSIPKTKHTKEIYHYDQIVDVELLEDGATVAKSGLGRAVAGGILFGGVGAIVGGVTGGRKTKDVCKSLQIKITLRNSPVPAEYIKFIDFETKKSGIIYQSNIKLAQDTMSALQLAVDMAGVNTPEPQPVQTGVSAADEIRKYKSLLDDGIITEEEFTAKKKQLLGL